MRRGNSGDQLLLPGSPLAQTLQQSKLHRQSSLSRSMVLGSSEHLSSISGPRSMPSSQSSSLQRGINAAGSHHELTPGRTARRHVLDAERVPSDPRMLTSEEVRRRHIRNKSADARLFGLDDDDLDDARSCRSNASRRSTSGEGPVVLVFDNSSSLPPAALFPNSSVILRPGQNDTTEFIVLPPHASAPMQEAYLRSPSQTAFGPSGLARSASLSETHRLRTASSAQAVPQPQLRSPSGTSKPPSSHTSAASSPHATLATGPPPRREPGPDAAADLTSTSVVRIASPVVELSKAAEASAGAMSAPVETKKRSRKLPQPQPRKALQQQDTVRHIA